MLTDFTCICYNFLFIVIAMSSAPSKSAPSSKRRKVQKVQCEIFDNVNNTDEQLKEDVVTRFVFAFTPAKFLKASHSHCSAFCIGIGIEEWEYKMRQNNFIITDSDSITIEHEMG